MDKKANGLRSKMSGDNADGNQGSLELFGGLWQNPLLGPLPELKKVKHGNFMHCHFSSDCTIQLIFLL